MRKDIYGVDVFLKKAKIDSDSLAVSCTRAEELARDVEAHTGISPLSGIEKIILTKDNAYKKEKIISIGLTDCDFEREDIVYFTERNVIARYYPGLLEFSISSFCPLDEETLLHEIGHNAYNFLSDSKKSRIKNKYEILNAELIKRIKSGLKPDEEANKILNSYSFLDCLSLTIGSTVCFEGYVGKLSKVNKYCLKRAIPIYVYSMHEDESEFFAELFSMYFHDRKSLGSKNLLDFAEKILKK